MNIFICNHYDSKNEDIYIISKNIPFDKDKIYYYIYNNYKKLALEKTLQLSKEQSKKNSISQNNEESDELQIIDYPYQPKHQQADNNLNTYNSNKSSFIDNNSSPYYNCFNKPKHIDESIDKNKLIKNFRRKKHSFICLSNANSNLDNTINNNNNKIYLESTDIQDTIKGEDNINISTFKLRYQNIKNKNKNPIINQKNNIKSNNIFNKNKNKTPYQNTTIRKSSQKINKIYTHKGVNTNKNIILANRPNQKLINLKGQKTTKIRKKQNIRPPINKYEKFNTFHQKCKQNLNSNLKSDFSFGTDYKKNKYFYDSVNNIYNKDRINKKNNIIHKNYSDNNILINGYKDKENYNIYNNNNKYINNSKDIIDTIKREIKKEMVNHNYPKVGNSMRKIKK